MADLTKINEEILVKNAEGDPDTKATILYRNNIDYEPKVSVVMPVFNVEEYLRECLDSIVNQTLKEIEIICVDDGSTDSSLEILKEYAQKDNRISVLTQKNFHAGVARNAGLAVAKGEYIIFLDSDDLFELSMFEKLYDKTKTLNLDMVVCNASKFDSNTKNILNVFGINQRYLPKNEVFSIEEVKANWSKIFIPATWNKLYNTNFIRKHNLYFQKLISCNDIGFSLSITSVAKRVSAIPEVFVYYRKGTTNCISASRGKRAYNIILAYDYIYKFLLRNGLNDYINCLNESIKSNIQFEASNCTLIDLIKFKNKAKKYFGKDWFRFKNCFEKDTKFKEIYQNIFSIKKTENKSHKVITLLGIKLKIKIKNKNKKKPNKSFENFIYHNIRENSVLLVELNQYHGECLPGMAKYFIDIGYNVDVLMNKKEFKLNPFANYIDEKISLYSADPDTIKDILCSDIVEKYEHLYINSDRIYQNFVGNFLGSDLKYPTGKIITMCHDAKYYEVINFNTKNAEVVTLVDFPYLEGKNCKAINTHIYKEIPKRAKNQTTTFVVIGNIESTRKNHSILIDAVESLVSENIVDFKIVVIARMGKIGIPENYEKYFDFKGRLAYKEMYQEIENADFLLTLFDTENITHDRYLTTGASGSYQLMYGFHIPGLLPYKFQSKINGFNNLNSIGYNNNNDFANAMKTAIQMSSEEYEQYVEHLTILQNKIYNKSLNNLKEILHINYKYPTNTFISLGINCFNRVILTRHHLKRHKKDGEKSLPFDLCVCPLKSVIKCLEEDFNGYFDNLRWDDNKSIWENPSLKITYNHDLDCPSTNKQKLINRYSQRIENFREIISDSAEKVFVISIINPQEDDHININKLYELLQNKCSSTIKLTVVVIAKEVKFAQNELNKDISFKHIPHPYPNFWGEWFKGEYFNSPEGIAFEKAYIDFVENCTNKELTDV